MTRTDPKIKVLRVFVMNSETEELKFYSNFYSLNPLSKVDDTNVLYSDP